MKYWGTRDAEEIMTRDYGGSSNSSNNNKEDSMGGDSMAAVETLLTWQILAMIPFQCSVIPSSHLRLGEEGLVATVDVHHILTSTLWILLNYLNNSSRKRWDIMAANITFDHREEQIRSLQILSFLQMDIMAANITLDHREEQIHSLQILSFLQMVLEGVG